MQKTKKGRKVALVAGLALVVLSAAVVWTHWEELRSWYALWRDFESLGKNDQGYPEYRHRQTGIVFVGLPGGTFMMGSPDTESDRAEDEGPVHKVTLGPFLIAKYEVTNTEYEKVMGSVPSYSRWPAVPVETVSWENCQAFCEKVGLSLPTEAQWEYACRAGEAGPFAGTGKLDDMGWFKGNHRLGVGNDTMHRPGDKPPNNFGIHDMHGNLAEWCRDWYHKDFYKESVGASDPLCEDSGSGKRVIRGGDWNDPAAVCRSASRNKNIPARRCYDLGFRPGWSPP